MEPKHSFMKPTFGFMKKLKEKPMNSNLDEIDSVANSINYVVGPKVPAPINSLVMGDF